MNNISGDQFIPWKRTSATFIPRQEGGMKAPQEKFTAKFPCRCVK